MFRVTKVTTKEDRVVVELDDPAQPYELRNKFRVDILVTDDANVSIWYRVGEKESVALMRRGKENKHPFDENKMNSIESELENALRLFKELWNE